MPSEALRILEEYRLKIVKASDDKLERGKDREPEHYRALFEGNVLINSVYSLSMDLLLQRAQIEDAVRLLVDMADNGRLSIENVEDIEVVLSSLSTLKQYVLGSN